MKNKVWIVSPLFLAFPVFMVLIAVVAWPNMAVFFMAIAGAAVSLIVYIATALSHSARLSALTKSASSELSGDSFTALRNFSLPVVVLGDRHTYDYNGKDCGKQSAAGMSLPELSALCESLGMKAAYNLDGGGSSSMCWNKTVFGHNDRHHSDILAIIEP